MAEKINKFDEDYFDNLEKVSSQIRFDEEMDRVYREIPPVRGEKNLDLGCGTGRLGLYFLSRDRDLNVSFSDISPLSSRYLKGHNFINCPIEKTPFNDNTFDKIYCLHAISHFEDEQKSIVEIKRILKKDGRLLIITPNQYYVNVLKLASFLRLIPKYKFDKTIKKLYNTRSLKRVFRKNKWTVEKIYYFGSYPNRLLKFNFFRMRILMIAKNG
jgi:ubiquinone/menaquinone biosynthesis C-methylase UbiE